jgi:hypothetical protein
VELGDRPRVQTAVTTAVRPGSFAVCEVTRDQSRCSTAAAGPVDAIREAGIDAARTEDDQARIRRLERTLRLQTFACGARHPKDAGPGPATLCLAM